MSVHENWIHRVDQRVARWCMRGLGQAWLVAVSGGGDSVGLLLALHHMAGPLGLHLSVAHLDHGVRGEAARADAAFAEALAGSLDLPFMVGTWRPRRSTHFETDARRARYDWLVDIGPCTRSLRHRSWSYARRSGRNDSSSYRPRHRSRGLAGMPRTRILAANPRIMLVRPLLAVSRQQIRDYLSELNQSCREDESNADLTQTRARMRHDLLPKLAREYNPNVARGARSSRFFGVVVGSRP